MTTDEVIRVCAALASDKRLQVLEWLEDPTRHFPPQRDGDLEKDGVCSVFIADKLGVSKPTTSRHMRILTDAGLVVGKSQKGWTFYKLNRKGLTEASKAIEIQLGVSGRSRKSGQKGKRS